MLKDATREAELEVAFCDDKISPPVDLSKIDTLHELLALALDDFEKVLGDRRYAIDMLAWHMPDDVDGKCAVCLAGSVIAKSLGAGRAEGLSPNCYPDLIGWRLNALNYLRQGAVASAATSMERAGVARYAPGKDYIKAYEFGLRWVRANAIPNGNKGLYDRRQGRRLLSALRVMQKELKEAGL